MTTKPKKKTADKERTKKPKCNRGKPLPIKKVAETLALKRLNISAEEISKTIGIGESTVSKVSTRYRDNTAVPPDQQENLETLIKKFEQIHLKKMLKLSEKVAERLDVKLDDPDAPLGQVAAAAKVIWDRASLVQNKPTQIVEQRSPDTIAVEFLKSLRAKYTDEDARRMFIEADTFGNYVGLTREERAAIADRQLG